MRSNWETQTKKKRDKQRNSCDHIAIKYYNTFQKHDNMKCCNGDEKDCQIKQYNPDHPKRKKKKIKKFFGYKELRKMQFN